MSQWEALFSAGIALFLGAISPGPSLAVVIRASLTKGRAAGIACAIGHGAGFGLYAAGVVFGLGFTMQRSPILFVTLQWCGVFLLAYLAWTTLTSKLSKPSKLNGRESSAAGGFLEGFLTAFLNPKIALFFLAVFSAVLAPEMSVATQVQIAGLGWLIDSVWYIAVAWVASGSAVREHLTKHSRAIDIGMAIVLLLLAALAAGRLAFS